jgi:methylamine dehydrogenase accessory protein MauD
MTGWWLASYVAVWALVILLAILVLALARQVGTLHLRMGPRGALELDDEGPPLGEAPEPVTAMDLDGRSITIGGPGSGQLVLFVSPGCPICREVLPGIPAAARSGRLEPIVVTDAEEIEAVATYAQPGVGASVVAGPGVVERYGIPGTPYAVVFDGTGVVRAKGTVNNLEQVEGLVDTAARRADDESVGNGARGNGGRRSGSA